MSVVPSENEIVNVTFEPEAERFIVSQVACGIGMLMNAPVGCFPNLPS